MSLIILNKHTVEKIERPTVMIDKILDKRYVIKSNTVTG